MSVTTPPNPIRLGRRPALDGLRGIAILLVMAAHTGVLFNGYVGVDIFFALSGFLITSLLYDEWDRTGRISLRRFYGRRAKRLLPALVLVVAAFAVVTVVLDPFPNLWPLGRLIVSTLLFANNWVTAFGHQHALGPLAPTWSLAQEEQFYLLWPLALWGLLRLRVPPAAVVAVLVLTIGALVQAVPHVRHAVPGYSDYFSPIDRAAELLIGCVAAIGWRHGYLVRALGSRWVGWAALAGLVVLLSDPGMTRRGVYLGAAVCAAPLIVNLLLRDEGQIVRILSAGPLTYTGRISYCLYLCHLPIHHLLTHYAPGHSPSVYASLVLAASFLTAGASWRFVESPVLRTGRRRRQSPGGSVQPAF